MRTDRTESCSIRIKKALELRGMKQSDLRRITKIPKSSMSQYMSGDYEPKQDRLYLISKALNVSEAWLMGFDVPMQRKEATAPPSNLTEGERKWLEVHTPAHNKQ